MDMHLVKTSYWGAKILIVDDERPALHILKRNLKGMGFQVYIAESGPHALDCLRRKAIDLMILDIRMPDMDGLEVCQRVREWNNLPIIILSASGEEEQKIAALELGADDYLTKPYSLNELVARIKAALRRANQPTETVVATSFTCEDLSINFDQRSVTVKEQEIKLTPQQYDLLKFLVQNAGRVITHRQALLHGWGAEYENETQYLHVFISQLRQKIEADPARPRYLLTERGVGYRFVCPSN